MSQAASDAQRGATPFRQFERLIKAFGQLFPQGIFVHDLNANFGDVSEPGAESSDLSLVQGRPSRPNCQGDHSLQRIRIFVLRGRSARPVPTIQQPAISALAEHPTIGPTDSEQNRGCDADQRNREWNRRRGHQGPLLQELGDPIRHGRNRSPDGDSSADPGQMSTQCSVAGVRLKLTKPFAMPAGWAWKGLYRSG